jgi:hypothetical protein
LDLVQGKVLALGGQAHAPPKAPYTGRLNMISHAHKTVFIHIPKCGGQSVETCFLEDLGLDWATRAPLLLRRNDNFRIGPCRLAHMTALEYTKFHYLSEALFESYYSFAIVRDPVSRVLSMFNYLGIQDAMGTNMALEPFLYDWLARQFSFAESYATEHHRYHGHYWFVRPQADFVNKADGTLAVDQIFTLESLSPNFESLKSKAGLKANLRHVNKSTSSVSRLDLNLDHIKFIEELYYKDVKLLLLSDENLKAHK